MDTIEQVAQQRYKAEISAFFAAQAAFYIRLVEIIENATKEPQTAKNTAIWRTIEEKQPPKDTPVLVVNASGSQFIARWMGSKWNASDILAWLELEPYAASR